MPLKISPLTEADVDEYVAIRHAAFEGGVNKIFYNRPVTDEGKASIAASTLKSLREEPTKKFLKVADAATGEIISCGKWIVPPPGGVSKAADGTAAVPQPIPECNLPAWTAFHIMLNDAKNELMGARPCYVLDVLVTHPNHHRRGAGKMLIEWGLARADEEGLEAYVEASEMGTPLYSKYGFNTVKVLPFDMSEYGGDGIQVHNCMVRNARPPKVKSD
ncbi:hypothetical protein GQ53DRAFT_806651 [Thozetella sp. PMI_491]|nr:hypothetical protein GQ53DRAFT_806651 [Thozetella sp. PMI_491]